MYKNIKWIQVVIACLLVTAMLSSLISVSACSSSYTTYKSPAGLFGISYPSDWDLALDSFQDVNAAEKNVIDAINSNTPMQNAQYIFSASKGPGAGPAVFVSVESVSVTDYTYDKVVEAYLNEIKQPKSVSISFNSIDQVKTKVGGKEATILDVDYNIGPRASTGPGDIVTGPAPYRIHELRLIVPVDKMVWIVECAPPFPEDFNKWEPVFQKIVKSLRINK
jgi:hypothetical protein